MGLLGAGIYVGEWLAVDSTDTGRLWPFVTMGVGVLLSSRRGLI